MNRHIKEKSAYQWKQKKLQLIEILAKKTRYGQQQMNNHIV